MYLATLRETPVTFLALCLIAIGYLARTIVLNISYRRKYRFPNEVPGLPLVGNSFQMPATGQGPYIKALADKYGEMFTMKFGSTPWLFLNSRRVAHELLDKRAAIYSSRQNLAMAHELASGSKRILLMPYGDLWRRERKVMHQILNRTQQDLFYPFQDLESKALLYQYLETPDLWYIAHGRFANSVIMSVVFGRRTSLDDPDLKALLSNAAEFVKYLMPGRALVDLLPWLLKIPYFREWQPWRWHGDKMYRSTARAYKKQMDDLRERRRLGIQKPCFMTEFLDMGKDREFGEEELYFMSGTMLEAGSDTTRVSLHEMAAGAALFPDWVERVRRQLDEVCGHNAERLPTFEDMPRLPLVKAVAKETLRWKPAIAETGIPHALIQDDEFEGYRLPAGTVVTWNHWGISNSTDDYENPDRFWPERFLNDSLDKPPEGHLGFGAGRRLCVGYTVAWNNLFIAISRLIYCYDFKQDPSRPIDLTNPFPVHANEAPFQVRVQPRSEAHKLLIERECKAAAVI